MTLNHRQPVLFFAMLGAVMIGACSDKNVSETEYALDSVVASAPVRSAWEAQRARLGEPRIPAPREADVRLYYALREALYDPDRRETAAERFLTAWEADAPNPLWLELAVTKRAFVKHRQVVDSLMVIAAGIDTTTAVHHFVQARRTWGRDRGAPEHFRQAALTASAGTLLRVWAQLRLARIEHDAGDVDAAILRMADLLPEAWTVGGPPLAGSVWQDLSYLTRKSGRLGDALLAAHAAEVCARAIGDGFTRTRARLAIGRAHLARREFSAAYDTFVSCAQAAGDSNYHRWLKDAAGLMAQTARISGDPDHERTNLLAVHAAAVAAADSNGIILARIALGSGSRRFGDWPEAEAWFSRAHEADAAWTSGDLGARIDRERAILLTQQGRYAAAESLRVTRRDDQDADWYGQGALETWIDLVHQGLETDRPDLAYRALAEARKLALEPMSQSASYDPVLQLESVAARFHARQGELRLADAALARARARADLIVASPDAAWFLAQAEGLVATEAGDPETAYTAYATCARLAEDVRNPDLIRRSRVQLGAHLLGRGAYAAAESLFSSDRDAPEYWTRLNARLLTGMCRSRAGDPEAARRTFAAVDSLLGSSPPRDLHARLRLEQGRALAALDQPRYALQRLDEARRSRSAARIASQTDIGRSFNAGIEREIAEETLTLLYAHPDLVRGADRIVRSRDVASWGRRTGPASDPADVVNPRLEFFVGDRHAFAWALAPGGPAPVWTDLPHPERLQDLIDAVETDMSYPGRPVNPAAATELGRHLLQPALSAWSEGATLEIVPDGRLAGLPWAALPVTTPSGPTPVIAWGSLLLVTGVGSADGRSAASSRLLALGTNGDAAPGSERVLFRAEDEAAAVAAFWPGEVDLRLGTDARWPELRAGGAAGYKAIHIASHTRVYEGADGRSTIHVAGLGADTPLTVPEIPALGADADLIYLSSCEGARRHRSDGRGVTSFAEAFLTAGAGAVVASSVLVDDDAAAALAAAFYRYWLGGMERATALRAALIEVRGADSRWEHPFYWAFTNLYQSG